MRNKHIVKIVLMLGIFLFNFSTVNATDYYVSPTGSDSSPGTIDKPWQHIAFATCGGTYNCPVVTINPNHVTAGDTLYIRGGTYKERDIIFANSGSSWSTPIIVTNYKSETVLIDGNTASLGEGVDGEYQTWCINDSARHPIFYIDNVNYIKISGLTMKNGCKAGVLIGYDHNTGNITIENNKIYNTYEKDNTASVYLNNYYQNGVVIRNNILHDNINRTGQSRGAGVEIFTGSNDVLVENNEIYNVVIGIHYKHGVAGSSNTPIFRNNKIHDLTQDGKTGQCGIRASTDNLIITNNLLYDIATDGRAAIEIYHEDSTCDRVGSLNNQITHNTIVNAYRGISLNKPGSCTDRGAKNIIVKDNLIYNPSSILLKVWQYSTSSEDNTISNYNLYYPISKTIKRYNEPSYSVLSAWQSSTGLDTDSTSNQPIFIDETKNHFALADGSPGKNAASDGTDMGADISKVGPKDLKTPGSPHITQIQ